jgi:hypothetical protein
MTRRLSDEARARMREAALKRWARPGARAEHSLRMQEGQARAQYRYRSKGHPLGDRITLSALMDRDVYEALSERAWRQSKSVSARAITDTSTR